MEEVSQLGYMGSGNKFRDKRRALQFKRKKDIVNWKKGESFRHARWREEGKQGGEERKREGEGKRPTFKYLVNL